MSDEFDKPDKNGPQEESPEPEGGPSERERGFLEERRPARGRKEESRHEPAEEPSESESESEPLEREREFLRERMIRMRPKGEGAADTEAGPTFLSAKPEAETPSGPPLVEAPPELAETRRQALEQFRQLRVQKFQSRRAEEGPGILPRQAPVPPPADNWIPIGPSVLRQGQGAVRPAVSGRTPAIAVAPGGTRIYIGAANGGVWRSDDTGQTWRSLMDAFDRNPTPESPIFLGSLGTDSLAIGALAIDPANPDRIFVGTGEGSGGAYFGVGPVVSFDGGSTWISETLPDGVPWLGSSFYALAIDPGNPDRLISGSRQGIHRREPDGSGGFHWVPKALPIGFTWVGSVVAAQTGGVTIFYAAPWNGPVFSSPDGEAWTQVGTGFPQFMGGRISLAVQPDNPNVIYALDINGNVYRLDTAEGNWRSLGMPPGFPGTYAGYCMAIEVAPDNVNRIYVAGSTIYTNPDEQSPYNYDYCGALYRCEVILSDTGIRMDSTYIGGSLHADLHALVFAPGDPNKLWVGCDGGVFYSTNPTGSGLIFMARNTGLQTLTMNHLGQHPTEDAVLFAGTQDNGGERFTGEEAWLYSAPGDAGFAVVNWENPTKVLITYTRGTIFRFLNGGERNMFDYASVPLEWEDPLFYAPLVGTPPNPGSPTAAAEADLVAFGSVRPWISTRFGDEWRSIPTNSLQRDRLDSSIRSLVFASADRLYAGTIGGGVYRFDRSGERWRRERIDIVGDPDTLPPLSCVTDIAVDPSNPERIYITFGGFGDYRHVWFFDGTQWEPRSGPAVGGADSLLNVQANAIVIDPAEPAHLYVGTDIGVWRSTNSGVTWEPFSEGLPDAAVTDMLLHNPRRLLRAATHGRSVWERNLADTPRLGVELYVRDTQLDQGRFPTVDGLRDPSAGWRNLRAYHWAGPDIKLDTPDVRGRYQFPLDGRMDFHRFVDSLTDNIEDVFNHTTYSTPTTLHRAYVQVHNRGVVRASGVRVMLLVANPSAGLPALPAGYEINVRNGIPIHTADWHTVGLVLLDDVRVGMPGIAGFDLPSSMLPPSANLAGNNHPCLLALIHHPEDQYTSTLTHTDHNSLAERKAAHKNWTMVQFVGMGPDPAPVFIPFRIHNPDAEQSIHSGIRFHLEEYYGRGRLYGPALQTPQQQGQGIVGPAADDDLAPFKSWGEEHIRRIRENLESETPYDREWSLQRIEDVERVLQDGFMFHIEGGTAPSELHGIQLEPGSDRTFFLALDRPEYSEIGQDYTIEIIQTGGNQEEMIGGLRVRVEIVIEPGT
jgi:hypothetical protein